MTEQQICDHLGVSLTTTWWKAKKEHPELVEALAAGRAKLCADVRGALVKRALGYTYKEVKTTRRWTELPDDVRAELISLGVEPRSLDRVAQVREETVEKYQAPDVKAADLLLRNYAGPGTAPVACVTEGLSSGWQSFDPESHEQAKKKLEWEKERFERSEEF